jgi:uncharacterized protein
MVLKKIERLKREIKKFQRVAVAFSGGKDSFFLLKMSVEMLGKANVTAFFVNGPFNSMNDQKRISYLSRKLDFELKILKPDFTLVKDIWSNPRDRCYHCKKFVFKRIRIEAAKVGFNTLFDGTSFSDLSEYRPGLKAIEELRIVSPLRDAGITSEDIESLLTQSGIEPFYLSSSTCLATRFPYNIKLSEDVIRVFDEIEAFLVDLNIFPVRVRYIPEGIRIETSERHFEKLIKSKNTLVKFCEEKGLKFITLDIGGLKSGVWD